MNYYETYELRIANIDAAIEDSEPLKYFIDNTCGKFTRDSVYPEPAPAWSHFHAKTTIELVRYYQLATMTLDAWHDREAERDPHPSVKLMLEKYPTENWSVVADAYPHVSKDGTRLAYTRSPAHGIADRQTTTSAGKFIRQHWPDVADDEIRDVVSLYSPDQFEILTDPQAIVNAAQTGPKSCMAWPHLSLDDWEYHPYTSYKPELGWALAVRISGHKIDGRALVHTHETDGRKHFVRSFCRCTKDPVNGISYSDTALESWLKEQGYKHEPGWRAYCQLIVDGDRYPYIDGDVQRIDDNGYIDDDGEYECANIDGTYESSGRYTCDGCGDRVESTSDTYYGSGDELCESCLGDYIYVNGRTHYTYVSEDDAVYVSDQWYHIKYIGYHGIVELADGTYEKKDECACVNDEWYLEEDDRIVWIESLGEHRLYADDDVITRADGDVDVKENCWSCHGSDKWFSNDDKLLYCVFVDGKSYHLDDAPSEDEDDEPPTGDTSEQTALAA